ncbi:MAG: glycosyltransferase [Actinomycetota bacterium]|nr:glycosyltransferase [Actinomycetota bacterium]
MSGTPPPTTARPSVSVIVPFRGDSADLDRLLADLQRLELDNGDEVIVADNRPESADGRPPDGVHGRVRVCAACGIRSPGFARNRAAALAAGEWLVFIDADTVPSASLVASYFEPAPAGATAILAGEIVDFAASPTLAARHSAGRGQLSQGVTLGRAGSPYAQTANCAVRRMAFTEVGGFAEDARAGEDADLCFRIVGAGWKLEARPRATVRHRSRESLSALLGQLARHGSGAAWLNRRYPGVFAPPRPAQLASRLARHLAGAAAATLRRDRRGTQAALLEFAEACAFELGRLLPNRARREG